MHVIHMYKINIITLGVLALINSLVVFRIAVGQPQLLENFFLPGDFFLFWHLYLSFYVSLKKLIISHVMINKVIIFLFFWSIPQNFFIFLKILLNPLHQGDPYSA